MTTYYIVRRGWNAANQTAMGRAIKPADTFQSGLDKLVAIVEATSEEEAKAKALETGLTVYNGQSLRAYKSPREIKWLTRAIREYA